MKTREQFTLKGPLNFMQNIREILEVLLDIRDLAVNKLTKEEKPRLQATLESGEMIPIKRPPLDPETIEKMADLIRQNNEIIEQYQNPLSTYKARLKWKISNLESIPNRDFVPRKEVLDLIDEE
jgi:hypothetical protein